jgi:hypothetical protein
MAIKERERLSEVSAFEPNPVSKHPACAVNHALAEVQPDHVG